MMEEAPVVDSRTRWNHFLERNGDFVKIVGPGVAPYHWGWTGWSVLVEEGRGGYTDGRSWWTRVAF